MNVLLWAGNYAPHLGGVAVVAHALAGSLTRRGHAVQVVTQSSDDEGVSDVTASGVVHRLPFHHTLSSRDVERVVQLTARVAAIKRHFQPDVIHAHAVHPSELFLLRTQTTAPCPVVFTLHGWTEMATGPDTLRERMLRAAGRVTACSQHVIERAAGDVPDIRARAVTIYNGVQDPGVPIAPLPFDPPRMLCVGRLVKAKGFDRVLAVLPALLRAHPALRVTIVGNGEEREALEHDTASRGLGRAVTFAGEVARNDVFAYLNAATLLVLPSRVSEGFPMVALEAAAMGRPVVAIDNGGTRETVLDGQTGFLVENGDPIGLDAAIRRVLDQPDLAAALGHAGRRRVLDHFDWDARVTEYETLYADVCSAPG